MHVLMWLDPGHEVVPGGHRVQMESTAEALRRLGVEVTVSTDTLVEPKDFDLIHTTGLPPPLMRSARLAGTPLVLSPIYAGRRYVLGQAADRSLSTTVERAARRAASLVRRGVEETGAAVLRPLSAKSLLFETADLLLPNSHLEGAAIANELGVSTPWHVVPNAVDPSLCGAEGTTGPRNGVLYVGRIDPHKNQLALIHALKGTGIPLTLVGPTHPHHGEYYRQCARAADGGVTMLPAQPHSSLARLYAAAAVHAMPSWFETTGLTSLEAALCGSAVVTTDRGWAREYFLSDAEYCNPASRSGIRDAIEGAMAAGPSEDLRQRVRTHYTWDAAAEATLEGYKILLAGQGTFRSSLRP